jgi:hypothetical protein
MNKHPANAISGTATSNLATQATLISSSFLLSCTWIHAENPDALAHGVTEIVQKTALALLSRCFSSSCFSGGLTTEGETLILRLTSFFPAADGAIDAE